MEDHRDAFFFWQSLGIREACCLHVDAHLDTSEFEVPILSELPLPQINCGNYLLHALRQGLVSEVIWVIPPHLCNYELDLTWALGELGRWNFLKLDDVAALRMVEGRVHGQLEGRPLTICTSDRLPPLTQGYLLDIDADYFLGSSDEVWQTPFQLHQLLGAQPWQAVTVAYSVQGGYTPVQRRFLGNLTQMIYAGQADLAFHYWRQLSAQQPWGLYLPTWLEAARLVTQACGSGVPLGDAAWLQAALLDPGYALQPFDLACQRWQRQDFAGARRWLDQVDWVGADYLRGLVANSQLLFEEALGCWANLSDSLLTDAQKGHLGHLRGLALVRLGRHDQAVQEFTRALQGCPRQASLWRELARAQSELGLWEPAAKSFRKSIQLAPQELESALARVQLAEVYFKLGQISLMQAECQRVRSSAAPGNLKLQVEKLAMKAALRNPRD
ncbi:tetratricopeptide repeat protein [bacterium]|nr:tetratricopeptide repeat protein [bacterium]